MSLYMCCAQIHAILFYFVLSSRLLNSLGFGVFWYFLCLPEDGKETHDTRCKPDQLRQVEQESHVSASASKEADHGLGQTKLGRSKTGALEIHGFSIEGVSVGGQETCVMIPAMKVAFDIGHCLEQAVSQNFFFITHAHMDHIVCNSLGILSVLPWA
jgi:hypothetical protein